MSSLEDEVIVLDPAREQVLAELPVGLDDLASVALGPADHQAHPLEVRLGSPTAEDVGALDPLPAFEPDGRFTDVPAVFER